MKKFILSICLSASFLLFEKASAQVSAKTLQQIKALVNEKQFRSLSEQKIDSKLLQAIRERENRPMAEGVQLEPANVGADKSGNLLIDISATVTDELLTKIQSLGAKIIFPSAEYHTIRASVNLSIVRTIAGYNEVQFIQPAVPSVVVDENTLTNTKNFNQPTQKKNSETKIKQQLIKYIQDKKTNANSISGQDVFTVTEGDRTHRADDARNTYGYSGEGIKIGVLSNSYNVKKGAPTDVKNGDLPGKGNPLGNTDTVTVVQDYTSGTDEGRAMLQIIHDIAPKAKLFFATANVSEAGFASNIKKLRFQYHCDIIVDDVEYLDEPPFQDGMVAQAVNSVTADGALYFASAGNYGSVKKSFANVFEGDFNDKGSLPFAGKDGGSIHNFGTVNKPVNGDIITNSFPLSTLQGNRYLLNWSDPIGKSSNDYDLFLVKADGTVKASSTNVQHGAQDPVEFISVLRVAKGDRLVIFKDSSAKVRAFRLNAGFAAYSASALAVHTNGQVFGHNCAVNAFSIAATPATLPGPYPNAFNNSNTVEYFSSDGPRKIFYNADSTAVTPNNFLFSTNGGVVRKKPDITAADGVSTNVNGTDLFNPYFYGTSAAAPHAGAIAALLKSADPTLTPAQIRSILQTTALDIEAAGYDNNSGYGVIQAFQAMQKLNPKPYANIVLDSVFTTDANPSNHNGFIDPGENGNITIKLVNTSLAKATSVKATLSAISSGIKILQGTATYGTINGNDGSAINSLTPYVIKINSSVACGTVLNFSLKITYGGGKTSSATYLFSIVAGTQPYKNLTATLGNPLVGAGYSVSTGTQIGRLGRYVNIGSTCESSVPNPGVSGAAGLDPRKYDAYLFINNSSVSQCVTVTLAASNYDSLYSVTYNDSGFIPATPEKHFLAEPQLTSGPFTYSFEVAPAKSFTVVVNAVYTGTLHNKAYTLGVSLSNCQQSVLAINKLSLNAIADQVKQQIPLHWTVSDDKAVRFYEVQRSNDGAHFTSLQTVSSSLSPVEKTYEYIDALPVDGDNYYRIKKVNNEGAVTYSNIVKSFINILSGVTIAPNPASTFITITSKTTIKQIQLFSAKGGLLRAVNPESNIYKLSLGNLSAGNYFLRIQTDDNVINKRFIKQ